ncbi:glycosyltransferase family 2 protein [Euzebya rosea]|uniref:glycosyltransferase family 2 protein n=1 Tax=Euzebya rosea TaxID=2052804 RepID=UPI000D3EB95C
MESKDLRESKTVAGTRAPRVLIAMPVLNEAPHIRRLLEGLRTGTYPVSRLRVLVLDGGSTDGTVGLVEDYGRKYDFVELLHNPGGSKPAALNLALQRRKNYEVFVRLDAHASYPSTYLEDLVGFLMDSGADNVGGVRDTHIPSRLVGAALAALLNDPFAAGDASYRLGSAEPKDVDTVFGGCYRMDVFDRIGLFDERLLRAQDREFNYRLRHAGGRIAMSPTIRCEYVARSSVKESIKWTFDGARWLFYADSLTDFRLLARRNFAPLSLLLLGLTWLGLLKGRCSKLTYAPIPYVALSLVYAKRSADRLGRSDVLPVVALLYPIHHVAYGAGSLLGLLDRVVRR